MELANDNWHRELAPSPLLAQGNEDTDRRRLGARVFRPQIIWDHLRPSDGAQDARSQGVPGGGPRCYASAVGAGAFSPSPES